MRALRLDFAARRGAGGWPGAVLLVAGGLAAAAVGLHAFEVDQEIERLGERKVELERRLRGLAQRAGPVQPAAPEDQRVLRDMEQVLDRLATPWQRLFEETAAAAGDPIALTGLNPDTQTRTVRISGIAPDLPAVHAFVARLAERPGLAQVHLAQHEAGPAGATPRVGFTVIARWKARV